jgi:hypothetical protein
VFSDAVTDHLRSRRAARDAQNAAITEVLTASIDLAQAVGMNRERWSRQTAWRARILIVAAIMQAIPDLRSWSDLADRAVLRNLLGTARDLARGQEEAARTFTLDYATTTAPRTSRFFAAVSTLTLGADKELADAARNLGEAGSAFLEAAGARNKQLTRARGRFEKELRAFRAVADKRCR